MEDWLYEGDETEGAIIGSGGERYPCRLAQGQIRVHLPFSVDQNRMRELLRRDGWAVAHDHETVDSQGWGPAEDLDGYYPYWLQSDAEGGGSILAFPPQEYRVGGGMVADTEGAAFGADVAAIHRQARPGSREPAEAWKQPVVGSEALKAFAQWIPYLRAAAETEHG